MKSPLRIFHVITSLESAGAQMMLLNVLRKLDRRQFESEIVSLTGDGAIGGQLRQLGFTVRVLDVDPVWPRPAAIVEIAKWLRLSQPHVVHGWMYHGMLLAALANRLADGVPCVWGIHHLRIDPHCLKWRTKCVVRSCSVLSRWLPAASLYITRAALEEHVRIGFSPLNTVVMRNGVDVERFRPDPAARAQRRRSLGIGAEVPLVGCVARFAPEKDHQGFIQAAALLARRLPEVRFLLCGEQIDAHNHDLVSWIEQAGVADRCFLLGPQSEVSSVMAALDLLVSSSFSETCPIVLCEAMACGVPCVATNVGDSPLIVGEAGQAVPPHRPQLLATAMEHLLTLPKLQQQALGRAARQHIQNHFNIESIVEHYTSVWKRLASLREQPRRSTQGMFNGHARVSNGGLRNLMGD